MSIHWRLVFVSIALAVIPVDAKDRNWETGTLVNTREQSYTVSQVTSERGSVPGIVNGGQYDSRKESHEVDTVWQEYAIKSGSFGYEATQPLRWRWSKPAVLTIGGPVRFAVEGRNLYLVDDWGFRGNVNAIPG